MEIRHAAAVGKLHAQYIEESNMSDLGPRFMGALYQCLIKTGYGVGYVMLDGGRVVGYSFGRFEHTLTVGQVIRRSLLKLTGPVAMAALSRPGGLLRAVRGLGQTGHVECEPGVGELLTIAVSKEARGGDGSRRVLEMLFDRLKQEGCRAIRWETLGSNIRAQRYYTKLGGHVVKHTEVDGKRNLWFEKKLG
jgi:ribosomal protein S18 acetylase RimI-like enzyme